MPNTQVHLIFRNLDNSQPGLWPSYEVEDVGLRHFILPCTLPYPLNIQSIKTPLIFRSWSPNLAKRTEFFSLCLFTSLDSLSSASPSLLLFHLYLSRFHSSFPPKPVLMSSWREVGGGPPDTQGFLEIGPLSIGLAKKFIWVFP